MKKDDKVDWVRADPRESTMKVSSRRDNVLVSPVLYCVRYLRQKRCRKASYDDWYLALIDEIK